MELLCLYKARRKKLEVVNIGIIIRNDHNDTFPVALTPQMVQIIQNLLTQIPKMQSKLVDPSGKQVTANESIPIIPRRVKFDWAAAYEPMLPEEEKKLMAELQETYDMDEAAKETTEDPNKKAILEDPLNPFNLELEATGKANEGMSDGEVAAAMKNADQKLVDDATYPESLKKKEVDQSKPEEIADITPTHKVDITEEAESKGGDCTVEIDQSLNLGAKAPAPGGE